MNVLVTSLEKSGPSTKLVASCGDTKVAEKFVEAFGGRPVVAVTVYVGVGHHNHPRNHRRTHFLANKRKKDKSGRIIDFLQQLGFNSNSSFSSFSFSVFYFSFLAVTIYFPHIFMMWSLAVVFPGSLVDFLHRGIGSKAKPGIDSAFEQSNALLNPECDRQRENN